MKKGIEHTSPATYDLAWLVKAKELFGNENFDAFKKTLPGFEMRLMEFGQYCQANVKLNPFIATVYRCKGCGSADIELSIKDRLKEPVLYSKQVIFRQELHCKTCLRESSIVITEETENEHNEHYPKKCKCGSTRFHEMRKKSSPIDRNVLLCAKCGIEHQETDNEDNINVFFANFMEIGGRLDDKNEIVYQWEEMNNEPLKASQMKFSSSLIWIMPVFRKIGKLMDEEKCANNSTLVQLWLKLQRTFVHYVEPKELVDAMVYWISQYQSTDSSNKNKIPNTEKVNCNESLPIKCAAISETISVSEVIRYQNQWKDDDLYFQNRILQFMREFDTSPLFQIHIYTGVIDIWNPVKKKSCFTTDIFEEADSVIRDHHEKFPKDAIFVNKHLLYPGQQKSVIELFSFQTIIRNYHDQ